jgi:hypothetical protein
MSSIIKNGDTFHGIGVFGRGVFTNDEHGETYAGQYRDGHACGLAVLTFSGGHKAYAEHGPDGQCDGRCLLRSVNGDSDYCLVERGRLKDSAVVDVDGTCAYNDEACAPDDPRLLALIAQVAPVEVRPAAPGPHPPLAPKQSSDGSAGSFCPRRRWQPPLPPRCTPMPHAVAGGCASQQPRCKARPRSDACAGFFAVLVSREARTLVHPSKGQSRQLRCHAIVQHAAVPKAGTRGGAARLFAHVAHRDRRPGAFLLGRALQFGHPVSVWQAEEAVANLPLRLAVRVHCGHPSSAGVL